MGPKAIPAADPGNGMRKSSAGDLFGGPRAVWTWVLSPIFPMRVKGFFASELELCQEKAGVPLEERSGVQGQSCLETPLLRVRNLTFWQEQVI